MHGQEREMLACPSCGNNKGNTGFYKPTSTTNDKITYHRKCKKCDRRFKTYLTRLDPYEILDTIKRKTCELAQG